LPNLVGQVEEFLSIPPMQWQDIGKSLKSNSTIQPYRHLMTRIEPTQVDTLLELNRWDFLKIVNNEGCCNSIYYLSYWFYEEI
jgi:hypothetical protein